MSTAGNRNCWRFVPIATVTALVYWWFADWWAYVEFPEGPMPKFVMPWGWQLLESGLVGVLASGVMVGAWWLICWARRRLTSRNA